MNKYKQEYFGNSFDFESPVILLCKRHCMKRSISRREYEYNRYYEKDQFEDDPENWCPYCIQAAFRKYKDIIEDMISTKVQSMEVRLRKEFEEKYRLWRAEERAKHFFETGKYE